jgi:hypothetical protein
MGALVGCTPGIGGTCALAMPMPSTSTNVTKAIYRYTQAHLWVMHAFGRHLARLAPRSPELTRALQS